MRDIALYAAQMGREAAEAIMVDTCRIERPGKAAPDGRGGTTHPRALLYEGKCRVQRALGGASAQEVAGHEYTPRPLTIHLPVGAVGVEGDDVVTVTETAADPLLVGRVFRVVVPAGKSLASAYRIPVEEVL